MGSERQFSITYDKYEVSWTTIKELDETHPEWRLYYRGTNASNDGYEIWTGTKGFLYYSLIDDTSHVTEFENEYKSRSREFEEADDPVVRILGLEDAVAPNIILREGTQDFRKVRDPEALDLLNDILEQLKIMTFQLSQITDIDYEVSPDEVER